MSLGSDVRGVRSFKDTRHEVRRVEGRERNMKPEPTSRDRTENTNPSEETRPSPDTHSNVGVKDLS